MPLATVKGFRKGKFLNLVAKQYGRGIKEEEVKRLLT
jgi:FKBP-type peptidyl-prolyl cis-trans isomerase (trigger factor)